MPRKIKNSSQDGTKQGETRATFILREDYLEQIKSRARSQGKEIKQIVAEALSLYLSAEIEGPDQTEEEPDRVLDELQEGGRDKWISEL